MTRDELLERLRDLRPALEAEGVRSLALFGSRARGDERADSDVDLLIDIAQGRKFSLLDLIGVAHVVEEDIGLKTDVLLRRGLEPQLAEETNRDSVLVF